MSDKFQPQLAAKVRKDKGVEIYLKDRALVQWPMFISPKLDGIRTWNPHGDGLYSRTMKLIPNINMQRVFGTEEFRGIDGEGIHGSPYGQAVMQSSTSACMTRSGPDDVTLYAFNFYDGDEGQPFERRLEILHERFGNHPQVHVLEQTLVNNWDEAEEVMGKHLLMDAEGSCLANPRAPYVLGRPSLKQSINIKMKLFDDMEGEIVGFEERYSNQNEQRVDERGYSKRSSHQENQVAMNTLGAFICQSPLFEKTYKVGTGIGLNDEFRQYVWDHRDEFLGKWMTHTYHKLRSFERPSLPSYRGIRLDYDGPENKPSIIQA